MVPLRVRLAIVAGVLAAATQVAAAPACAPRDPVAVAETVVAMYAALTLDDTAGLSAVLADDFYAYDGGRRFDARSLADLIRTAHATGKIYRWNVVRPDVRIDCATAWVAYVNEGSSGDATGVKARTRLESAALRFTGARWRIEFLHSTPAVAVP